MNKQQGSAHVIVAGVLAAGLLGALGFIFWQNFVNKDEVVKQADTAKVAEEKPTEEKKADTKQYNGDAYSFEYPADGWLVVENRNDYDPTNPANPEVRTTDYSPSVGIGIDAGAKVSVYSHTHTYGSSLEEDKQNTMRSLPSMENIKDTVVDGVPAYSYTSGYEGYRYITSVIRNGIYYQIVYQYAGDDQSVHRDGYDTVVESFKFK